VPARVRLLSVQTEKNTLRFFIFQPNSERGVCDKFAGEPSSAAFGMIEANHWRKPVVGSHGVNFRAQSASPLAERHFGRQEREDGDVKATGLRQRLGLLPTNLLHTFHGRGL
jgi:hypothetical protein